MDAANGTNRRRLFRRAITFARHLTPNARLLGLLYEEFASRGTEFVYVTNEIASQVLGASSRTVSRARAELVKAGWLVETERAAGSRAARYRLVVPASATYVGEEETEPQEEGRAPVRATGWFRRPRDRQSGRAPAGRRGFDNLNQRRPTPRWDPDAPECVRDGSILRPDGTCPICTYAKRNATPPASPAKTRTTPQRQQLLRA